MSWLKPGIMRTTTHISDQLRGSTFRIRLVHQNRPARSTASRRSESPNSRNANSRRPPVPRGELLEHGPSDVCHKPPGAGGPVDRTPGPRISGLPQRTSVRFMACRRSGLAMARPALMPPGRAFRRNEAAERPTYSHRQGARGSRTAAISRLNHRPCGVGRVARIAQTRTGTPGVVRLRPFQTAPRIDRA